MTTRKAVLCSVLAVVLCSAAALPVQAGGSWWDFEDHPYMPGEIASVTAPVAWSHNAQLGTPADGPYFIYLVPSETLFGGATQPNIEEIGVRVGIVEVRLGPYRAADGDMYGPHHAIARFEVPALPPGRYHVVHCNRPCTKFLGDILGGNGFIIADDRQPSRTATRYQPGLFVQGWFRTPQIV